jgi:hypothetical protein
LSPLSSPSGQREKPCMLKKSREGSLGESRWHLAISTRLWQWCQRVVGVLSAPNYKIKEDQVTLRGRRRPKPRARNPRRNHFLCIPIAFPVHKERHGLLYRRSDLNQKNKQVTNRLSQKETKPDQSLRLAKRSPL